MNWKEYTVSLDTLQDLASVKILTGSSGQCWAG